MVDPSFYAARHSGKTVGVAFPECNIERSTQGWKIYVTDCFGNIERIIR
jgi:hypothetical protein